jgi:hypothetical protein
MSPSWALASDYLLKKGLVACRIRWVYKEVSYEDPATVGYRGVVMWRGRCSCLPRAYAANFMVWRPRAGSIHAGRVGAGRRAGRASVAIGKAMNGIGETAMCQELPRNRRWFKLVKVINLLCCALLLEPLFRSRPEYILDIALIVGCAANFVVYKYQTEDRFISKVIWIYYLFLSIGTLCYELWLR